MAGWISLTFDDALDEHLDHALPVLNQAGLRGTFYTHLSSPAFMRRRTEWQQAAAGGHELGNHTIFHPADARKGWVRPGNAIDHYSLDRMKLELEFANESLAALDSKNSRTFAYPCSNSCIGSRGIVRRAVEQVGWGRTRVADWIDRWGLDWGSTIRSYEPIVGDLFVAGRGGGLVLGQTVPALSTWRPTLLPSVAVEDWTLNDLQRHVRGALAAETWAILQFHGVGGGHHMDCPLPVFQDFVAWLRADHADRVLTVLECARRLWPARLATPSHSRSRDASTAEQGRGEHELAASGSASQ